MSTVEDRRRERYGDPIVSPRVSRILVAILAIGFLAVVALVGIRFADQPVKATLQSYEHVATDRIAVEFVVTMRPGTDAVCAIQAKNEGAAQVGFVEVPISAQPQRTSSHRTEIATQGRAVTAEIIGCEKV